MKLKRFLKRLAVMFVATVVFCLIAEGVVLLVFGEQVKFPRHVVGAPFGVRINEPNAEYRHKSPDVTVWFRINGQGMRADRDYPYEKPEGTLRILSLGDSFTAGYEVDVEDCFSSVLERELRAKGYRVEVLNAGVSGYSTAEEYLYLERELLKYDPDLVLVSFYTNDVRDNLRTGLFLVDENGELVQSAENYVPMGGVADFLNTNPLFSFLSEYSNAFALLKDVTTLRLKEEMEAENERKLVEAQRPSNVAGEEGATDESPSQGAGDAKPGKRRTRGRLALTGKLYQRIYALLRERNVPLVIHSIPHADRSDEENAKLVDEFPRDYFDLSREGVSFVSSAELLTPYLGKELLYWQRSNKHWTPFAHGVAGKALAEHVDANGLLKK